MRAAICDDQPQALEELKKMLLRIPAVKKVHTYSDMNNFWATLKDGAYYDVVFMDIEDVYKRQGLSSAMRRYSGPA